jgi:hypothetical protein
VSFPTITGDAVEGALMREPQSCLGPSFALSTYSFFLTGTSTPANVYQDGNISNPFPNTGVVSSDQFGRFPPIYLDPAVIYKVVFNGPNGYTWTRDPYTPPLSTRGTSQNTTYGMQVAATGEVTVTAPNSGGTGLSMKVSAGALGTAALKITGTAPGTAALIVNSSATTGAQTATFAASNKPGTATSPPAGWLPITCDGVQYYTPIWHGNAFEYYFANPTAVGEVINATTVTFNGNGSTSVTGGTATPPSWFVPNTVNIGSGYYIQITKTSGLSGVNFSIGNTITNITSGGLTITENAAATIVGTYIISTSVTGTPVVAAGSITLSGGNGPTSASYNVTGPLNFATNGTTTDGNNNAQANWYSPTTASIGSSYYISVNQTGGTAGFAFSGISTNSAAPTSMAGALALTITPTPTSATNVVGTYTISSDSGGVNIVATGSITLNEGSNVQSPTWSGTPVLNLASNGTATLNGVATSSWYSPTTAGVGASYWIDITRTSGTTGVNFSAAQGAWTNISNSGLSIGLSSYTGDVGTVTVTGSYQISSSSSGSPVLGAGTVTLTVTGLTVIHVYTTGTGATETIPTGTTTCTIEVWGGAAAGGAGSGSGCTASGGGGGGGGGYSRVALTVSGHGGTGKTFTYTVGASSATTGNASTVAAGTVTSFSTITCAGATRGGNAPSGTAGAGGAVTNANSGAVNTTGNAGTVGNASHGGTGGAAITGTISGDGSPYAAGGHGGYSTLNSGLTNGGAGAVVFYYQ